MPELTLHAADNSEPVAWRIARLARVLERAQNAAAAAKSGDWRNALVELSDVEGDLTAVWRSEGEKEVFARFIDTAWVNESEDGDNVVHDVLERGGHAS